MLFYHEHLQDALFQYVPFLSPTCNLIPLNGNNLLVLIMYCNFLCARVHMHMCGFF